MPRAAVRLLHARDDHAERRPAQGEPASLRGGDPARARGQPVPLHGLPQHREGRAARGLDGPRPRRPPQEEPGDRHPGAPRRGRQGDRARPPPQGGPAADHRAHPLDRQHPAAGDAARRHGAQPVRARHDHQHRRRGRQGVAQRRHGDHRRDVADEQGALPNAWPITPEQVTPNHPPIAVERATFAGEIVAVVVARSAAAARDAAELVDVDYDELPAALDLKEAAQDKVRPIPTSAPTSPRSGSSTRPRPAPAATSTRRSRRPAATAS